MKYYTEKKMTTTTNATKSNSHICIYQHKLWTNKQTNKVIFFITENLVYYITLSPKKN